MRGVEHVIIYKRLVKKNFHTILSVYCAYDGSTNDFFEDVDSYHCITSERDEKEIQPATKEQRDLLFSKIREAGYEWNSEKKELKEIEPKKPIINVLPRELILSIWDLGNEWKELTNGCISTEYGTQLDFIQNHWHESEYYLKENQGKKSTEDVKILSADDILPYLGNNQVQDILEDMGMLDDNGRCPHTAEEIFKAGMEHAFNLNREAT